ncbi:MAG TPA: phosphoribosylformylglycinamidine synthase subunit PurL [Actinomycetota bacterium]|nr:phosphoribosylformylglycinamidine synthase subunit PurL [Actinomycetota bacterium]
MATKAAVPLYEALGLSSDEYSKIVSLLDREPSHTELAMYSVMWSEHCSYKSSRRHLKDLPTSAPWVLAGPGENAGVVEAAPGVRVAFKIESHNHPSAVEPYQGAATGVGGIVRDILALGARPIALLDSLRFGPLSEQRNRFLFDGVVRGIAGYGNALGLPTVGGEAVFDPTYSGNPLVNAMCIGIVEDDDLLRSAAGGPGQLAMLFGSRTGRDGIGGASILASREFEEGQEAKRPSVQVGDPFMEKLLVEACLELKREGLLSGLQDLGAAGITCALAETAAAGGLGVTADLDQVPLREHDMEPWEICMSESQERMLACIPPERVTRAVEVCAKWGLEARVVGRYESGGRLLVSAGGGPQVDVTADSLAEGPVYDRPVVEADRSELHSLDPLSLDWPKDLGELLLSVLASPTVASKHWVWRQYDHMVRLNTLAVPGSDGAVLRVPESGRGSGQPGLVVSTDGPGRIASLDPWTGGALAVCESARNVAVMGGRPLAVTNCLNFGSPERPEVMGDFAAVVRGMADACRAFSIPVTGGNVSFYNESPQGAVHPTPVVGMLGVLPDAYAFRPMAPGDGDVLVLLGTTRPELGGSEALAVQHSLASGRPPALDLGAEVALTSLLCDLSLGTAAHDLSEGGLAVALAEMCLASGTGASIRIPDDSAALWWLFSESTARVVVSCRPAESDALLSRARKEGVPASVIGTTGGDSLEVQGVLRVPLDDLARAHRGTIPALMDA